METPILIPWIKLLDYVALTWTWDMETRIHKILKPRIQIYSWHCAHVCTCWGGWVCVKN